MRPVRSSLKLAVFAKFSIVIPPSAGTNWKEFKVDCNLKRAKIVSRTAKSSKPFLRPVDKTLEILK